MVRMKIALTRDSVAMGDDMDAPHDKVVEIDDASVETLCQKIWDIDYLPSVQGVSTWVLVGFGPVAVFTKHAGFPPILELDGFEDDKLGYELNRTSNRLHFIYYAQMSLESIRAVLSRYTTVRDRRK